VYLTGRIKDMILRAGRNLYPQEVEEAVGGIPGVRKGCVAAFGSPDPRRGTERVILLAETRETDPARREALRRRIEDVAAPLLEGVPDDVVLAPPHTVLKTSSGKIRRAACRELYESGAVSSPARSLWSQIARLALSGGVARARRAARRVGELGYAGLWWTLLVGTGALLWPLVLVLPRLRWRWGAVRAATRSFLWLSATRVRVHGLQHLERCPTAVLVANHSSYLDGLVLAAVLPRPVRFVAKRELAGQRIAGPFLRRLGALFVERFELERSVEDARRVDRAVREGGWILFFPEGTFRREPGLRAFYLGAFSAAAQSGASLVPLALSGTRSILRGDQWFPRRAAVQLAIGAPLEAKAKDWAGAVELRDAARAWLLAGCGEPDLGEAGIEQTAPSARRPEGGQGAGR
jgi:1-acyl-sn-glycerol-3-phosphate acyltransferase